MNFSLYSLPEQVAGTITMEQLCELASKGEVFARAENSGCEGCYVEVARWNQEANEWQRFCFEKVFGGEDLKLDQQIGDDACGAESTAERIANRINAISRHSHVALVHHFPTWGTPKKATGA